jgi:hypothetical protein
MRRRGASVRERRVGGERDRDPADREPGLRLDDRRVRVRAAEVAARRPGRCAASAAAGRDDRELLGELLERPPDVRVADAAELERKRHTCLI